MNTFYFSLKLAILIAICGIGGMAFPVRKPTSECTTLLCPLKPTTATTPKPSPPSKPSSECTTLLCPLKPTTATTPKPSPPSKPSSGCTTLLCPVQTTTSTTTTPGPTPPQTVTTSVSWNPRIPNKGEYCECSAADTGLTCNQVCTATLATRPVCSLDTGKKLLSSCHAKCLGETYNYDLNACNFISYFSFLW